MVSANDADVGTNSQIDYSLAGEFVEFFTVGRSTGVITVSAIGVDYEAVASDPVVVLTVIATDKGTLICLLSLILRFPTARREKIIHRDQSTLYIPLTTSKGCVLHL